MALLDLLLFFFVVWLALSLVWLVRRRRAALPDRWEPRTRALREGGHVVELVCRGEPTQRVQRVPGDLDWEQLGTQLAEAMAEAEARAATLNGARPPSRRR
ncbi:MAG TPA: hypothetical protein VES79_10235 [Solirubrobacteraceae bacterium]|nr:hypothetical protein [Solirubrobacteraceae bacterium]